MFDAVEGRGGEVAQFGGDGLLALFAEPLSAVQAGQDMAEVAGLFNAERGAAAQPPIAMGIGISRGELVVGSAATARRAAHACVGVPALQAARLAEAAAPGLLIDETTRAGLPVDLRTEAVNDVAGGRVFRLL